MNPFEESLKLLEENSDAALGTIEGGQPFVSATGFLYKRSQSGGKGSVYILLSDLARHTKNIQKEPAVSLLIVENKSNSPIHERKRVTVKGEAKKIEDKGLFEALKPLYLETFPKASIFFSLPDFRFYQIDIQELHWIGGFGKAETIK